MPQPPPSSDIRTHTRKRGRHNILQTNLTRPVLSKTIKPGDDFYAYVNSHWLRTTRMPPFKTVFSVSEEIEQYIESSIHKILGGAYKVAEAGRPPASPHAAVVDAIGRLQLSSLRRDKQKFSVDYLKRGVRSLGCIRNMEDVATTLGNMVRCAVPTLLRLYSTIVENTHTLVLSPGTLTLPDIRYYRGTGPHKTRPLLNLVILCQKVSKMLDINDISYGIQVESMFVNALEASKRDPPEFMTVATLERRYAHIPWQNFFNAIGAAEKNLRLRIDSPGWLDFINKQFKNLMLEQWFSLLSLHTVMHALPYLPPPFDDMNFEFFGKFLLGQEHKTPQDELTYMILKRQMARPLSYLFVKTYLTPTFKTHAESFVKSLTDAAARRMGEIEWFEPATRRAAAEKVKSAARAVAWPLYDTKAPRVPELQTDNLLANIYLLEEDRMRGLIRRNGRHAKRAQEWDEPAFTVNAYYYNESNRLVIPAAIFAWPFYSEKASMGWNYGGLGAAIAHEVTHAFDTDGRNYDKDGIEEDWWTKKDTRRYRERTEALVRLFNQAKIGGGKVDGKLTLNENLADLGGLAIALDALKKELGGVSDAIRIATYREFFIAYAVSWRTKQQEQKLLTSLFLDRHSPAKIRVNYIVCHFDEWYEAFHVKTGDDFYLAPEDRIRIF
jgi:putative endopeptidase